MAASAAAVLREWGTQRARNATVGRKRNKQRTAAAAAEQPSFVSDSTCSVQARSAPLAAPAFWLEWTLRSARSVPAALPLSSPTQQPSSKPAIASKSQLLLPLLFRGERRREAIERER